MRAYRLDLRKPDKPNFTEIASLDGDARNFAVAIHN